jgi:hypothetical protein
MSDIPSYKFHHVRGHVTGILLPGIVLWMSRHTQGSPPSHLPFLTHAMWLEYNLMCLGPDAYFLHGDNNSLQYLRLKAVKAQNKGIFKS